MFQFTPTYTSSAFCSKKMVILPHSRFLQRSNILLLLVILWYCFSIPTSFVLPERQIDFFDWIDIMACLVLLADVLVNLHKAVLVESEVVTELKEIRKRYLKSDFVFDLLATGMLLVTFTWSFLMDENGHFGLLWLVLRHIKLMKLLSIFKIYGRIMNSSSLVQMLLFLIWIFVSINAIASGWMLLYPYRECA